MNRFLKKQFKSFQNNINMPRDLLTKEIYRDFKSKKEFTTADVRAFYQKHIKGIKDSTVNWKIYHLIMEGVLIRKKIGVYHLNK